MRNYNQPPVLILRQEGVGRDDQRTVYSLCESRGEPWETSHDSHNAMCPRANTCCTIKCTSKLSIFVPAILELFLLRLLNAIVLIRTDKTQGACKPTAPEAAWPKTFSELPHIAGRDGGLEALGCCRQHVASALPYSISSHGCKCQSSAPALEARLCLMCVCADVYLYIIAYIHT